MQFTLFKPSALSFGFLLSSLSLVTAQEVDQHQNTINLVLTLFGGSLALCCSFLCIANKCMTQEHTEDRNQNEIAQENDVERNAYEDSTYDYENSTTHYVRIND